MKILSTVVCAAILLSACGDSSGTGGGGGEPADGGSGVGGSAGAPSVGGAGGAGGAGGSPEADPLAIFYEDFHASRFSKASEDMAALDALVDGSAAPGDAATVRALAHLWYVSESSRDPSITPTEIFAEASKLLGHFSGAQEANPNDPRVPCWLGLTQITTGQAIGDQDMVDQGYATIETGVDGYPEFNLFCRALAYGGRPASDPDFQIAIDSLYETLDLCFGESVDRNDPDITPYLDQATSEGDKRVCWNDPVAPHNAEGFYLFFGDLLVKNGDLEAAAVVYENARLVAEYDAWPFKAVVEGRLTEDLAARSALYLDDVNENDPPLGGGDPSHGCTICHASSAAE